MVVERVSSPFRGMQEDTGPDEEPTRARPDAGELPLRELTGYEEEFLEANREDPNSARVCNQVLARCLVPPGADSGEALARVRALGIAERDRALVRLRQLSLGNRVDAEVTCPACDRVQQVDFLLSNLPLDFRPPTGPILVHLAQGSKASLRMPSAGDQEDLLDAGLEGVSERLTWLLARVLLHLGDEQGPFERDRVRALPVAVRRELEQGLAATQPELDLSMSLCCEGCGEPFSVPFDIGSFFLAS